MKSMHLFWIIFKYVASAGIIVSTILMFISVLQGYKKKKLCKNLYLTTNYLLHNFIC
jgi:hypothetical protein